MSLTCFGRCSICTLSFELDDVSTLKCGHTYHAECISIWINTAKNCPKCRMKNTTRDIIRLFVDEPDKSTSLIGMCNNNNNAIIDRLQSKLNETEDSKKAMEVELDEYKKAKRKLETKLVEEKENANGLIKSKERHIKNLEKMLADQDELKQNLDVMQKRLKASEFYALISSKKGLDDERIGRKIDKYSHENGNPDTAEFFKSITKQFKKVQKENTRLVADLNKKTQEKNKLAIDLEEVKKELESRKRRVISTSGASPASSNLDGRKSRTRPSLGFSFMSHDDSELGNKENDDSDIQILSNGPVPLPKPMAVDRRSAEEILNSSKVFNFDDNNMKPAKDSGVGKMKSKKNEPYLGADVNAIFSSNFVFHASGDME